MPLQDKMNIVLLGLTGFGNAVLGALLKNSEVRVSAVFTTKYKNPFPYYEEQQLIDLCVKSDIQCYFDIEVSSEKGASIIQSLDPDLIIVATFKQIIQPNVLNTPSLGIVNVHPALLPKYRGPNPTNTALLNGESTTGVTIHYLTEKLDAGNVLLQKVMDIDDEDTDGTLRKKLSLLASAMIPELVEMFQRSSIPRGVPQDEKRATYAPRPRAEEGYLKLPNALEFIRRRIKAFNPFPGTSLLINGRWIPVDNCHVLAHKKDDCIDEAENWIDIFINSTGLRIFKKACCQK